MTVGDGDTIGYDELQNRFPDIEFVNGNELPYNEHHSYSEIEKQTESETHKKMRENSKNYFICAGFDICDQAIGVMNNYTLADFVAVKQDTIIFVECLTEDCTKQEIIDALKGLWNLTKPSTYIYIDNYRQKIERYGKWQKDESGWECDANGIFDGCVDARE